MKEYLEWVLLNWITDNVVSQIIESFSLFIAACAPAAIKPAAEFLQWVLLNWV
jgi:hypothetical protein